MGLDVRRGIIIEKKEQIQEKTANLSRKLFVPDPL